MVGGGGGDWSEDGVLRLLWTVDDFFFATPPEIEASLVLLLR